MKKPKVSVCIPVYGTEKVLRKCLDSVAMQDFAEKEIVVDCDRGINYNREFLKKCDEEAKKCVDKFSRHKYIYINMYEIRR